PVAPSLPFALLAVLALATELALLSVDAAPAELTASVEVAAFEQPLSTATMLAAARVAFISGVLAGMTEACNHVARIWARDLEAAAWVRNSFRPFIRSLVLGSDWAGNEEPRQRSSRPPTETLCVE